MQQHRIAVSEVGFTDSPFIVIVESAANINSLHAERISNESRLRQNLYLNC